MLGRRRYNQTLCKPTLFTTHPVYNSLYAIGRLIPDTRHRVEPVHVQRPFTKYDVRHEEASHTVELKLTAADDLPDPGIGGHFISHEFAGMPISKLFGLVGSSPTSPEHTCDLGSAACI